jgi:hypothetical protein
MTRGCMFTVLLARGDTGGTLVTHLPAKCLSFGGLYSESVALMIRARTRPAMVACSVSTTVRDMVETKKKQRQVDLRRTGRIPCTLSATLEWTRFPGHRHSRQFQVVIVSLDLGIAHCHYAPCITWHVRAVRRFTAGRGCAANQLGHAHCRWTGHRKSEERAVPHYPWWVDWKHFGVVRSYCHRLETSILAWLWVCGILTWRMFGLTLLYSLSHTLYTYACLTTISHLSLY